MLDRQQSEYVCKIADALHLGDSDALATMSKYSNQYDYGFPYCELGDTCNGWPGGFYVSNSAGAGLVCVGCLLSHIEDYVARRVSGREVYSFRLLRSGTTQDVPLCSGTLEQARCLVNTIELAYTAWASGDDDSKYEDYPLLGVWEACDIVAFDSANVPRYQLVGSEWELHA